MAMFKRVFVALVFILQLQCFTAQVKQSLIQTSVDPTTQLPSTKIPSLLLQNNSTSTETPVDTTTLLPPTEIPTLPLQNDNNSTSNGVSTTTLQPIQSTVIPTLPPQIVNNLALNETPSVTTPITENQTLPLPTDSTTTETTVLTTTLSQTVPTIPPQIDSTSKESLVNTTTHFPTNTIPSLPLKEDNAAIKERTVDTTTPLPPTEIPTLSPVTENSSTSEAPVTITTTLLPRTEIPTLPTVIDLFSSNDSRLNGVDTTTLLPLTDEIPALPQQITFNNLTSTETSIDETTLLPPTEIPTLPSTTDSSSTSTGTPFGTTSVLPTTEIPTLPLQIDSTSTEAPVGFTTLLIPTETSTLPLQIDNLSTSTETPIDTFTVSPPTEIPTLTLQTDSTSTETPVDTTTLLPQTETSTLPPQIDNSSTSTGTTVDAITVLPPTEIPTLPMQINISSPSSTETPVGTTTLLPQTESSTLPPKIDISSTSTEAPVETITILPPIKTPNLPLQVDSTSTETPIGATTLLPPTVISILSPQIDNSSSTTGTPVDTTTVLPLTDIPTFTPQTDDSTTTESHVGTSTLLPPIEIQTLPSQIIDPTSTETPIDTTTQLALTENPVIPLQLDKYSTSYGTKLSFRKCCGLGQVYYDNSTETGYSYQCMNFSGTNHSPSLLNLNPQNLFLTADENQFEYAYKDFDFVTGFPSNCDRYDLEQFRPDETIDQRFYLTESGQLIFHQHFKFLDFKDYCIEELTKNEDFSEGTRHVYYCYEDLQSFPEVAITEDGKLQLDFIDSTVSTGLLSLSGSRVIHKCCSLNSVIDFDNLLCFEYGGLKSGFFEDLQAKENEVFFHVGFACPDRENVRYTSDFQLTSSGSVQIGEESDNLTVSVGSYCIEDFHAKSSLGLPEISIALKYCLEQPIKFEKPLIPLDPGTKQTVKNEELKKINLTKCCPPDSVIVGQRCEPIKLVDATLKAETVVMTALSTFLTERYNILSTLSYSSNVSTAMLNKCGIGSDTSDIKHQQITQKSINSTSSIVTENEWQTTIAFENGQVSLHYYLENYWDFHEMLTSCVDLQLNRNLTQAIYQDHVHHCETIRRVTDNAPHYPVFQSLSSVALFATFIIYFLVPTKRATKLVTSVEGTKKTTVQTMAMTLTGRILLCHVITLAVTFMSTAITQNNFDLFHKTQNFCTALGYIGYGTALASFSWLTIFCFDYCRIFRGSFKVSNDVLFIPYSAFGWGFPLLALIITSVAQFQAKQIGVSSSVNPNMGLFSCWFADGGKSEMIFFFIPVSILMILNTLFFISLLFNDNIMNCMKSNSGLRSNQSKSKESKLKRDVIMALKLFFISGVPWIFEIFSKLSDFVPETFPVLHQNLSYFLYVSTTLNSLRGVAIFIFFVLLQRDARRYLWRGLVRRFPSLRGKSELDGRYETNGENCSDLNDQSNTVVTQVWFSVSDITPSVVLE